MSKKIKSSKNKKNNIKIIQEIDSPIGIRVYKLYKTWENSLNEILNSFGLNQNQFYALYYINELCIELSYPTQNMIGKEIGLEKMMASKVISQLEKIELIERRNHPTDTRANSITLTKKGYSILENSNLSVKEFEKNFFKNIKNQKKFIKNLDNLIYD